MNILVLGNGFDLAHGLPTAYPDFLGFCRMIKAVYAVDKIDNADKLWTELRIKLKSEENTKRLHNKFSELYSMGIVTKDENRGNIIRTNTVFDELYDDIEDNYWVEYFIQNPMYNKENWIDFESEISKVIQVLDKEMLDESGVRFQLSDKVCYLDDEFMAEYFSKYYEENDEEFPTFKEIRDTLYRDMNRLIRALEIYLVEYVGKIECNVLSPDIKKVWFDSVLSFNYTDTYKKKYDPNILSEYDYIHGQAELNHTVDSNNMVLGIDEYLSKERKNKEVEFIAFKKFYQRIYKETGCKYKDWVDEIQSGKRIMNRVYAGIEESGNRIFETVAALHHNLYIFGHSLDVTDGDILRDLILNDNVHTTIFYYNKDVMGQQLANLVKVIGQDELIKRTGGSSKTIEFKQQADMMERN